MDKTDLVEVVRQLAVVFARRHVRHALIGGLAVGLRSRPRATKDADFIIRQEWSAVAQGEDARTAWLEDAIGRLVPSRK